MRVKKISSEISKSFIIGFLFFCIAFIVVYYETSINNSVNERYDLIKIINDKNKEIYFLKDTINIIKANNLLIPIPNFSKSKSIYK